MRVRPFADAPDFLAHIGPALAGRELHNDLLLGVVRELIRRPDPSACMLSIDEAGRPVLAAVMSPPLDLVLSTGDPTAIGDLIDHLCRHGPQVPGVFSFAPMAEAFADAWRVRTGQAVAPGLEMRLYALADIPPPDSTPGSLRCARPGDRTLLGEWTSAFFAEAGLSDQERQVRVAEVGDHIDRGTLYVWELDGAIVSMAVFRDTTPTSARIGPVYTPPTLRGRGYATACVRHLSRQLLSSGRKWCLLFADTDNPTSTGIYRRLGYQDVGLYREYKFSP